MSIKQAAIKAFSKEARSFFVPLLWAQFLVMLLDGCQSHKTIVGSYNEFVIDAPCTYTFDDDNGFKKIQHNHLSSTTFSKGHYSIKGNTLSLYFEAYDTLQPYYIINKKTILNGNADSHVNEMTNLITTIKVVDIDLQPIAGANLALKDANGKIISGHVSNREGNYPSIDLTNDKVKSFLLSYVGVQEFQITTDNLSGYETDLTAVMQNAKYTYASSNHIEKFSIIEMSNEKIILSKSPDELPIILNGMTDK